MESSSECRRHALEWDNPKHVPLPIPVGDLTEELADAARRRGGRVLVGRCYEMEQILAFAPWTDVLRSAVTIEEKALQELSPLLRREIARLLPGPGDHDLGSSDTTLVRQLIQRRLWDGRLPHENSAELSLAPGTGDRCDACGFTIARYQFMTVRIGAQDWRQMRLHQECFEIWDEERVKDAQPKPSHSR